MRRTNWNRTIINLAKLSSALLLLAAPWVFDFASEARATWNAWLSGCVVLAATARSLATEAKGEIEVTLAMGLWITVAPSVLGFSGHEAAAMAHVLLGFVISALAVADISAFSPERPAGRGRSIGAALQFLEFRSDRHRTPAVRSGKSRTG
jgi:hypothetical protein